MVISEDIFAMLLTHTKFKEFTRKDIAYTSRTTQVILALSAESKDKVNEMADKALAAGGNEERAPQDYGFMYGRSFNDLDGHTWEVVWMD